MVALASTTGVGLAPQLADSQHSILRGSPYRCNKVACKIQLSYRRCWLANAQRYDGVAVASSTLSEHSIITVPPQETTAICALWSGNLHLEAEDIFRVPLFKKTLKLKTTTYGLPGVSEFETLLT